MMWDDSYVDLIQVSEFQMKVWLAGTVNAGSQAMWKSMMASSKHNNSQSITSKFHL